MIRSICHIRSISPTGSAATFSIVGAYSVTGATLASPVLKVSGILPVKWMAALAVRFSRIASAECVYYRRNRLQMNGIDAVSLTAQVVNNQSVRHAPYKNRINRSMGLWRSVSDGQSRIALLRIAKTIPKPTGDALECNTGINCDLAEDSSKQFAVCVKFIRIIGKHLSLLFRFSGLGFRGLTHREALSF